jgi:N6-adenosine-specific RNA methylase IME4
MTDVTAQEVNGKLKEGLHLASYTFERAMASLEWMLEGDRWKMGGKYETPNDYLDTLRLDKFRAIAEQRKRIAKRIKELQPQVSNRQIGRTMGVHHDTIDRDLGGNPPPTQTAANESNASSRQIGGNPPPAELTGEQAARLAHRKATGTQEKQKHRAEREHTLGTQQQALPSARYGVIYADPPWRFEPRSRETGMDRAADNHYPTMTIEEIEVLAVPAADDAVLFLWATAPMLLQALDVMEAWDFEYKSHFIWNKDRIANGFWNRNKHEMLLIGTRGSIPCPAPGEQYPSVIDAAVGEHSVKPFAFREMIEEYYPTLPKLEMFAREAFEGWTAWGNEMPQAAE